jgi:hypothetical protein
VKARNTPLSGFPATPVGKIKTSLTLMPSHFGADDFQSRKVPALPRIRLQAANLALTIGLNVIAIRLSGPETGVRSKLIGKSIFDKYYKHLKYMPAKSPPNFLDWICQQPKAVGDYLVGRLSRAANAAAINHSLGRADRQELQPSGGLTWR